MAFDLFQAMRATSALKAEGVLSALDSSMEVPEAVRLFIGNLCLLRNVPVQYLIPDERFLPKVLLQAEGDNLLEQGSLKVFRLDPDWIESLLDGALSIVPEESGLRTTILAKALAGNYVAEVVFNDKKALIQKQMTGNFSPDAYESELKRRLALKGITKYPFDPSEPSIQQSNWCYSGFLMRSSLITAWPGLEITAMGARDPQDSLASQTETLQVLRFERLAPDTLFCLCEGNIRRVHFVQPRESLHFEPNLPNGKTLRNYASPDGVVDVQGLAGELSAADASAFGKRLLAEPLDVVFQLDITFKTLNAQGL